VGLGEIGLILTADGRAEALRLCQVGAAFEPVSAERRFAALIDDHLAPIIVALARETGITPRVLWSNAGNYFEHAVAMGERSAAATCPGLIHGKELLASRKRSDGRPNPLFAPIYYLDEQGRTGRRRRICCIRYLIPGQGYCGVCPIVRQDRANGEGDERQLSGTQA
ncbi:MAG: siderophore-iron reductase FhuF, partial [Phreatobacter sp.]